VTDATNKLTKMVGNAHKILQYQQDDSVLVSPSSQQKQPN